MKRTLQITFFSLLAACAVLAAGRFLSVGDLQVQGDAIAGGRIYDNWMLALDAPPPEGDQPLWARQRSNQRSGVVTWRCVECHGWDYQGADGAYGAYSNHYTGFTGLDGMIGSSQEEVLDWLDGTNNTDHNFLIYTNPTALNDLAAFLRTQQINTDLLIDPATGESLGDRRDGALIYQESCAACHGTNGASINFGSTLSPLYLGDIAAADPWRAVHGIRFGSPGNERMPSSEEENWSLSMVADVLAHMQTMYRGNPDFAVLPADPTLDLVGENQARVDPIVWGVFGIMLIVGLSVVWDLYVKRQPL